MQKLLKQCVITVEWEEMKMSDYIMHSSGPWKNHKWVRREGTPGNYRYYYNNLSSLGKDPRPSIVEERFKAAEAERQRKGAEIRNDQVNRKIDGMAGRFKTEKFSPNNGEVSGSAGKTNRIKKATTSKGDSIRNDMVNRMINAMSGKTVTQLVNANRAKAKAKKESINKDMNRRANAPVSTQAVGGKRHKTSEQERVAKGNAIREEMRRRSIRFNNGKTHKVGSVSSGKR